MLSLVMVGIVVGACTAHAVISMGPDGLRTFAVVRNPDGSSVPCPAFGLTNPVAGILDGRAGAREPVWLRADDGRHRSIVRPAGFTLRPEPDATIYTEKGGFVGRAGIGSCSTRHDPETPPGGSTTRTSPRASSSATAIQF